MSLYRYFPPAQLLLSPRYLYWLPSVQQPFMLITKRWAASAEHMVVARPSIVNTKWTKGIDCQTCFASWQCTSCLQMVGYYYCFHTDVHAEFIAMAVVYTIGDAFMGCDPYGKLKNSLEHVLKIHQKFPTIPLYGNWCKCKQAPHWWNAHMCMCL